MTEKDQKEQILSALEMKSLVKQKVYDQTYEVFDLLKEILQEITSEFNSEIQVKDKRVGFEYKERSQFEVELKVAGDILIFSMHSNIFEFDREHNVWKLNYVKENSLYSFCGIINVYNFLSDSFKYNRLEDLGYLITRLFVNLEKHFFVEGKRQQEYLYNNFGKSVLTKKSLKDIILRIINYAIEFDLLVPPYDNVKIASVGQLNQKVEYHKMKTGKRLGFKFNSDDVS
jgi:hemerythrin